MPPSSSRAQNQRNSSPSGISSYISSRSSSPSRSSSTLEQKEDEIRTLKRLCNGLLKETRSKDDSESSDESPDCKKLGRGVPKLVSLFVSLTNLIDEADKNLLAESDEDAEDLFEGLTEDEAKRRKRSYARSATAVKELRRLIPNFDKKADEAPIEFVKFLKQLQDGATNARSDDVSRIMNVVAIWINQQYPEEPQLSTTNRRDRGIHHPITGMLLCPIRYDWNNADIRGKLRAADPDLNYTVDFCIRALYRGFKGSVADPEKGFLQSQLLVKTFKYIFTSPSSSHDVAIQDDSDTDTENVSIAQRPTKTRRTEGSKKVSAGKAVAAKLHTSVIPDLGP